MQDSDEPSLIALASEGVLLQTGAVFGVILGQLTRVFDFQPPQTGDWWGLCFYALLYGWMSGDYDVEKVLAWAYQLAVASKKSASG